MGIRKTLVILLVAALLMGYAGCAGSGTMTLAEYKQSMSVLQDRVNGALETALEKLQTVNEDDIFDLFELQGILEEQRAIIDAVAREAIKMDTPPEVEDLHKELLRFYERAERATGQIANAAGFFHTVLPMLTDVRNLALPNMPEDSQVARINAACEEDVATMHGYTKHLKGITPPEELQLYRDKLTDLFNSVEEAVAGVDRATSPDDTSAFIQFQQEFPAVLQEVSVLQGEITVYIYLFRLRMKNLIRDGTELARQIEEL